MCRLAVLAQRGEISIQEKKEKKKEPAPIAGTPFSPAKPKATPKQRIKALSPKMQRDEQLESLVRQCIDDIATVMGCIPEQGSSVAAEVG